MDFALPDRAVMDLRGAIHHYNAMGGMILTTGKVEERAIIEGRIANLPPVALIDGETLARELVRLGIGVKSRRISLPACDEAFFSTLKSEVDLDASDLTPEIASALVTDYIDNFYNPERRHSTLDYLSPIEYELKYVATQQAT